MDRSITYSPEEVKQNSENFFDELEQLGVKVEQSILFDVAKDVVQETFNDVVFHYFLIH